MPSFQCTEKRGENTLFYLCTERQEQVLVRLLSWFLGQDLSEELPDIPGRLFMDAAVFCRVWAVPAQETGGNTAPDLLRDVWGAHVAAASC